MQMLHETILDKTLDKRNFRKKVLKENLVVGLDEKQVGVLHKPAQLFKLNAETVTVNKPLAINEFVK
jgi:8-oxo-dGTP diphosphatase